MLTPGHLGGPVRCGVLGDPIGHSLSPVLHGAAFTALGLDWSYTAHRVPSGGLPEFLAGLGEEWRGLSLTMPLKREALSLTATLSSRARTSGAANTLVRRDGGWHGDNTDIPGAVAALRGIGVDQVRRATLLGGGATATSVGLALVELGARELRLLVRDPARAGETVEVLRGLPDPPQVEVGALAGDPVVGDVVVSTIPASAQDDSLVQRCADVPALFEVLYDPWPTPLAHAAGDRPLATGLDLLVHQAALQTTLFTGLEGPVEVMRAAGEAALAGRSPA